MKHMSAKGQVGLIQQSISTEYFYCLDLLFSLYVLLFFLISNHETGEYLYAV